MDYSLLKHTQMLKFTLLFLFVAQLQTLCSAYPTATPLNCTEASRLCTSFLAFSPSPNQTLDVTLPPSPERMENTEATFSTYGISEEEGDKLVAEVIRYIIFKTHQNSGCPIKRDELTQLITKNYPHRSLPALVLNKATTKLSNTFGYNMKELQRIRPSSTNQARSSQSSADPKSYIITSQLDPGVYRKHVEDARKSHLSGFAFVVIGGEEDEIVVAAAFYLIFCQINILPSIPGRMANIAGGK